MATTKEVAILIKATDRATKTLRQLDKVGTRAFKNMGIAAAGIGVAMGVVGVAYGALIKGGIKYNAALENYENILTTVFKSQKRAREEMEHAIKFAAKTPFEIPQIAEATAKLETYGFTARKWLPALGDMASATGKSILQAVEALADAQMGEFERLKEFGIKKEMLIPQGLEVDAKGAVTSMESVGDALFAFTKKWEGQMDIMSNSFKGMTSNLRDLWSGILGALARPVFDQIKVELRSVLAWANKLRSTGKLDKIILGWAEAGKEAIVVLREMVKVIGPDLLAGIEKSGLAVRDFIKGLDVERIREITGQIVEFTQTVINATMKVVELTAKNWKLIAAFAGFVVLTKVAIWLTTVVNGFLRLLPLLIKVGTAIKGLTITLGIATGAGLVAGFALLALWIGKTIIKQREFRNEMEALRKSAEKFNAEDLTKKMPEAVETYDTLTKRMIELENKIEETQRTIEKGLDIPVGSLRDATNVIGVGTKQLERYKQELLETQVALSHFLLAPIPERPSVVEEGVKPTEPIDIKPFEVATEKTRKLSADLTKDLERLTLRRVDFELNQVKQWADGLRAAAEANATDQITTKRNESKALLTSVRGSVKEEEAIRKKLAVALIAIEQNKMSTLGQIAVVEQLKSEKVAADAMKQVREAAKDATDIAKQAAHDEFIARAQLHIDLLRLKGEEAKANEAQARLNASILAREMNDGIAAGKLLQAELQAIRQTETDQKEEAARADEAILRGIELKTLESQGRMREAALIRLAEETKAMERAGSSRLALMAHQAIGLIEIDKQVALANLDTQMAAMKSLGISSKRMTALKMQQQMAIEKAAAIELLNFQMDMERRKGTNAESIALMTAEGRAAIEQRFALQSAAGRVSIVRQAQEQIRQSELQLQEQLESRRQDAFDRETDRILQLEQTYSNYIDGALTLVDTLMSAQEQGWTRTLAALIQFTTRAIADFIRLRGMEKLKRAEEKKTAAAFHKAHGARMLAHAAEAAFFAAMAVARLDFVRAAAFTTAAGIATAAAATSAAKAVALETSALKDQAAASKDLIAATVVEGAGQVVAMGLRAQADAADRQKQAAEDRMRAEERLQQEILNAQGREGEARLLNLERQIDEYNKLGVDQDLLRRWEAVQEAEAAGMLTAVPESIPVLPPPPIRIEPPGSIPVEPSPPIVIRTPAIIPVEQPELIAIEEPDLAPRRIIVEPIPPIIVAAPAFIPVRQPEPIRVIVPESIPVDVPVIAIVPPEPIEVIAPESIPIEEPPSIVVEIPAIIVEPPEPIVVLLPDAIPVMIHPPIPVVQSESIPVIEPEPVSVIVPEPIGILPFEPIAVILPESIPTEPIPPIIVSVPPIIPVEQLEPLSVIAPEPIHVLLPAIVVDIPASIPVEPVEPISVLAPESIPVEGLPPIVVEMPVSVPVERPEPIAVIVPEAIPVIVPEFIAIEKLSPVVIEPPPTIPVEQPEPLPVIPPESIPVLPHPPIAVETPAFIPVIQAEPVAIIPPEPIQVLIPESISIEPIPPVIVRASILVTIEQPEPITVILPGSIAVEIPPAIVVEVPEPIAVEQPGPVSVIPPKPIEVSVPEFIAVEELQPVVIEPPAFIPVAHVDPLAVMPSEPIAVVPHPPIPVITPEPLSVVMPDPVAIEQPPIIMVRVPASIPIEHIEPVAVIAPEPIVVLMPDFITVEQVEPIPVASAPAIPVQIPEPIPIASPEAIPVDIPTIDLGADIVARDFEAIVIRVQGILSGQLAQVADLQRRVDEGRAAGIEVRLVELQLEQDISRAIEIATNKIVQAIESLSERVIAPVAVDMPELISIEHIEPIQVLSPDPVTIPVPESIPIQAIEPIIVEVPESIPVEQHEAVKLIPPEPIIVSAPEAIPIVQPEPIGVIPPEPISLTVPEMIPVQAIKPVIIDTPEPIPIKLPEPIEVIAPLPIHVLPPEPIPVQDIDPVIVQLPASIPVERPEPISIVQPEPIMITVPEAIPIAGLNELDRIMTVFMKSLAEVQSIISIDDIMMQGREIQAQQELQSRIDQNRVIGIETGLVEHLQRMTTAIQANTSAVLAGGDRSSGATVYQTIYFQGVDFSSDEMLEEWAEAVTPFIEEVEGKALDTDG